MDAINHVGDEHVQRTVRSPSHQPREPAHQGNDAWSHPKTGASNVPHRHFQQPQSQIFAPNPAAPFYAGEDNGQQRQRQQQQPQQRQIRIT